MPKYRITGDICHSGVVIVEADNEDDLVDKVSDDDVRQPYIGEFEIEDEQKADAFRWDGGEIDLADPETRLP